MESIFDSYMLNKNSMFNITVTSFLTLDGRTH